MKNIYKIEIHYYQRKNSYVYEEYRVFEDPYLFNSKTASQLTKREKDLIFSGKAKHVFHF